MGGGYVHDDGTQDYDNPKVQQIREELGEFDYDEEPNLGNFPVEYRPEIELENHAKYNGEWITGKDVRQVMVFSTGPMEENMKVAGKMENNMELEPTQVQVEKQNKENGLMVKD